MQRTLSFPLLLLLVVLLLLLLPEVPSAYSKVIYSTSPDPTLQRLFQLDSSTSPGWLGSDVATSIQLGNTDEYVWLFGDTLMGSLVEGSGGMMRRNITSMPRNSIGKVTVNPFTKAPGPIQWDVQFNRTNINSGRFNPPSDSHWFWPCSGVYLNGRLYLTAYLVYESNEDPNSLGFKFEGTALISISNPHDPLPKWKYNYSMLPGTNSNTNLVSAMLIDRGFFYFLGDHDSADAGKYGIMARLPVDYQVSALEYLAFETGNNRTTPGFFRIGTFSGKLHAVLPDIPETSIVYSDYLQKYLVLYIEFTGKQVMLSTSDRLEGPWADFVSIYEIPSPFSDWERLKAFSYAPKIHMEFTRRVNELVFTFMSNTLDFDGVLSELSIYVPQVLRTTITKD